MRVLMISTDRKLFENGSSVSKRMIEYGSLFEELHVVVFSLKKLGFSTIKLSENVTIYSTEALTKLDYVLNAVSIGKNIVSKINGKWIISSQDPFETGLVGLLLKKKTKFPLQLQMHGDFWSPYYEEESFMNKMRLKIAKLVIPKADCIRVVSERIKKGVKRNFNPPCPMLKSFNLLPIIHNPYRVYELCERIRYQHIFQFCHY